MAAVMLQNMQTTIARITQGQILSPLCLWVIFTTHVPKNMNGAMNAELVRDYAALAVENLYPEGDAIRQVDPA